MANMIYKAIDIAIRAHDGKTDNDGEAYILHPLAVGLMGNTDEERMAGFLLGVTAAGTGITEDVLLDEGIPVSVVNAVRLLKNDDCTSYEDYASRIIASGNPIAMRVAYNDLTRRSASGRALRMVSDAIEATNRVRLYEPPSAYTCSVAVFAAGCFWGVQHYMNKQKGVIRTLAGYTGGKEEYPTYEAVRNHRTSHLEAVLVEFDEAVTSYEELCKLFFEIHDPAQTDGQGPDIGQQYLSGVFCTTDAQMATTQTLISILRSKQYEVNTRVEMSDKFWIAEQYHQNYYETTGGSPYCHIRMKKF